MSGGPSWGVASADWYVLCPLTGLWSESHCRPRKMHEPPTACDYLSVCTFVGTLTDEQHGRCLHLQHGCSQSDPVGPLHTEAVIPNEALVDVQAWKVFFFFYACVGLKLISHTALSFHSLLSCLFTHPCRHCLGPSTETAAGYVHPKVTHLHREPIVLLQPSADLVSLRVMSHSLTPWGGRG